MQLTWKILSLKTVTLPELGDYVSEVTWNLKGEDEAGTFGAYTGVTSFDFNNPNTEDFIPYENLQESEVITWIEDSLGTTNMDSVLHIIQREIDEKNLATKQVSHFPWEPEPEPVPPLP
jgi:hypothetical protein